MIRIKKSNTAPTSLTESKASYNGQDVEALLLDDQSKKCYICEQKVYKDYEIEHLKSQKGYPELSKEWTNLLLACGYCNKRKSNNYDSILSPLEHNIEELIIQRMSNEDRSVEFTANTATNTEEVEQSIDLLNSVFNGKNKRLRKVREEQLYEELLIQINSFKQALDLYLRETDDAQKEAKIAVEELLRIDSEFLGFKYWIIKENKRLWQDFGAYCIWHKQ